MAVNHRRPPLSFSTSCNRPDHATTKHGRRPNHLTHQAENRIVLFEGRVISVQAVSNDGGVV